MQVFTDYAKVLSREQALRAWVAALGLGATAMVFGLAAAGYTIHQPVAFAVLALVALGLERQSIRLSPQLEVSVASLVYIFTAVVFGPLAGVLIAVAGLLVVLPRRDVEQPVLRWITWTSASALSIGGGGLTAADRE